MNELASTLGAPGIYPVAPSVATPAPRLAGVSMDVCAFVGVAPRGPARVPALPATWRFDRPTVALPRQRSVAVPVESFDAYRQLYGGFEGPGRLPFAVASFFEQGGRRAFVVRVVHRYPNTADDAAAVARGPLRRVRVNGGGDAPGLVARDEGAWGNALQADLGYTARPLPFQAATASHLVVDLHKGVLAGAVRSAPMVPGTLLRLTLDNGTVALRFVSRVDRRGRPETPGTETVATFEGPPLPVGPGVVVARAEVIEGELLVSDGERRERHAAVGLSRRHPRWLATVLCNESTLVFPAAAWAEGGVTPDDPRDLPRAPRLDDVARFTGGVDRYADLVPSDFFAGPAGDAPAGVAALDHVTEMASLCVPDLYEPAPLPSIDRVAEPLSVAGDAFAPCVVLAAPAPAAETVPPALPGLHLDPAGELETIIALQRRLLDRAERQARFVVLLDVPPGLTPRQIESWRARLTSSYAAAYHPWLHIDRRDDQRDALVLLNPSAVAAGVLAARELRFGLTHGPANTIAEGVVATAERVSQAQHGRLHPLGVNVFVHERDGVRLSAARTLASDTRLRQLSVRRLLIMLRRALAEQMQWLVFETNDAILRAETRSLLRGFLRRLYQQGGLRGAREGDAFRVQCDAALNPPRVVDAGRLIATLQIAPAEPLEFIHLSLTRTGDGTVVREDAR